MSQFRILSIDGGGIKGVFPAAFLAEIEKSIAAPLYRYFDLIAGTSTGGIIALGLGLGMTAAQITEFYKTYGPAIFRAPRSLLRRFFAAKYSPEPLRSALEVVFGHLELGDSKVRLIIPSFNANSGEIHIYKTRHHERFLTDHRVSAVDVGLATTAAPTYFPAHKGAGGAFFVDGAVWANNPVGNAVVEAISWLRQSPSTIDVLSIGCTQFPMSFAASKGITGWAQDFVEAALRGQSGGSLGAAYSLLGHDRVKRVNPAAPPGKFSLDNAKAIDDLAAFGYLEARKESSELCKRFFSNPTQAFFPVA